MHQKFSAAAIPSSNQTLADAGGLLAAMDVSLWAPQFSEIVSEITMFALMLVATFVIKGRQGKKKPMVTAKLSAPKCPQKVQHAAAPCGKEVPQLPPWRRAAAQAPTKGGGAAPKDTKASSAVAQRIADVVKNASERRGNSPEEAVRLYDEMRATGEHLKVFDSMKLSGHSPMEFYGSLIRCAGRSGRFELLEQILDDMAAVGVARPRPVYETVMKILAGKGLYRRALDIYERMQKDGLEPTAVTLECLSSFAAEIGDAELAMSFFERLVAQGTPSIRSYMTMIHVHGARRDFAKTREVFEDMLRRGVVVDNYALNTMLSTGVAADDMEGTRQMLEKAQGLEAPVGDTVSYNTVMKGYAQAGDTQNALKLLEVMSSRGIAPNAVSFNTALDASVRGSKVDDAWRVQASMKSAGIQPDKYTCSILMKGLRLGKSAEQIGQLLELTQQVGLDATTRANIFRGMIDAASKLKHAVLLRRILAQMRALGIELSCIEGSAQFRVWRLVRLPLFVGIQSRRCEEGIELLKEFLDLGGSIPPDSVESLAQAAQKSLLARSKLQALGAQYPAAFPRGALELIGR